MKPKSALSISASSRNSALPFAIELAHAAGKKLTGWFGHTEAQTKADGTTLTQADTAVDTFICTEIRTNFPDDQIISEEMNHSYLIKNANVWVIDPLDGTTNFSQGMPLWGVSIALLERGQPTIAVLYFPVLNLLFHAGEGAGAFANGDQISTPTISEVTHHSIFTCSAGAEPRYSLGVPAKRRTFGSTIYELCMVARGQALFSIVAKPKIWDLAAAWLLINEAGGVIGTLDGSSPFPLTFSEDYSKHDFPLLATATPVLWQQLRTIMQK